MAKTFPNVQAFTREVDRMERTLARDAARAITLDQARQGQDIARAAASADLGGDPKFSGWAPTLDTRIKPTRGSGHVLMPTRTSAGPWTVAEYGRNTNAGFVNVRRTRDGGVRVLKSGRVSVRRRRRWNGVTAGKDTASDAVAIMERKLPAIAAKGATKAMRRHFDVD